jgi:hypothetical protein
VLLCVDSVDYVLVIILSDITDMVGGDLRVLQMPDASGNTFHKLQADGVPEALIETVRCALSYSLMAICTNMVICLYRYVGPGYGIFMQGSKILHTVSEVLSAREPRLSLVNSYMSCRPFLPDRTKYSTFHLDGPGILPVDYARHKCWRVGGQLKYLLEQARYGGQNCISPDEKDTTGWKSSDITAILRNAARELEMAADLIDGINDDHPLWLDTDEQVMKNESREVKTEECDSISNAATDTEER